MATNRIQFKKSLSQPQITELYGTEEKYEAALEKVRWPEVFCCSHSGCHDCGLVHGRRHKRYQCRKCRHQATLTAGTIMEAVA